MSAVLAVMDAHRAARLKVGCSVIGCGLGVGASLWPQARNERRIVVIAVIVIFIFILLCPPFTVSPVTIHYPLCSGVSVKRGKLIPVFE